jgi:hypothetical protein
MSPPARHYSLLVSLIDMRSWAMSCTITAGTRAARILPQRAAPAAERAISEVPGLRSSRIYIIDTKPEKKPDDVRGSGAVIADRGDRLSPAASRAGRADGIYVPALGKAQGDAPGGSSSWTPRPSTCSRPLGGEPDHSVCAYTTPGGIWLRHHGDKRMGRAEYREREAGAGILSVRNMGGSCIFWDLQKAQASLGVIDFGPDDISSCSSSGRRTRPTKLTIS